MNGLKRTVSYTVLILVIFSAFAYADFTYAESEPSFQVGYRTGGTHGWNDMGYANISPFGENAFSANEAFRVGYDLGYRHSVMVQTAFDEHGVNTAEVKWSKIMFTVYSGYMNGGRLAGSGGDPLIFTLDGTPACTERMWAEQAESRHWYFDLLSINQPSKMERTLCDGTYMMFIDFDGDGKLTNGSESLWNMELNSYLLMNVIDYMLIDQVYDGKFDSKDAIWEDVMVMSSDFKTFTTKELGITAFDYSHHMNLSPDGIGDGTYSDCKYEGLLDTSGCTPISLGHFRLTAWNPFGITLYDGITTLPTYGAIQFPLQDCSVHDPRYIDAENLLGERTPNTTSMAMTMYKESLRHCNSMEFTQLDRDRYMSHWIAGIASVHHTSGEWEKAKPLYEDALEMSPNNHFYLTDYGLLLHQLGYDETESMSFVDRALIINPDHMYAKLVKSHIEDGTFLP